MDEYTDGDARRLMEALAKYAEAFAASHTNPALTVKELADDLVESSESSAQLEELRDRIYDGLNNYA